MIQFPSTMGHWMVLNNKQRDDGSNIATIKIHQNTFGNLQQCLEVAGTCSVLSVLFFKNLVQWYMSDKKSHAFDLHVQKVGSKV